MASSSWVHHLNNSSGEEDVASPRTLGTTSVSCINMDENFAVFIAEIAPVLLPEFVWCKTSRSNSKAQGRGPYIYPLAFLVEFKFLLDPLVLDMLAMLRIPPFKLNPNGWRILRVVSVLNGLLKVNLGLKDLIFFVWTLIWFLCARDVQRQIVMEPLPPFPIMNFLGEMISWRWPSMTGWAVMILSISYLRFLICLQSSACLKEK